MKNFDETVRLLQQLQTRNTRLAAFDSIYKLYNKQIFMAALKIVRDHQVAEDVVHDVFVRLLKMKEYNGIEKLEPYLFTLCRNVSIDYLNSLNRKKAVEERYSSTLSINDLHPSARFDLKLAVQTALDNLPSQQSIALRLVYLLDLDINTAAELMQITKDTIKMHLKNGKKKLEKRFRKD